MNAQLQQVQSFTPEEQLDRRNWIGGSDAAAAIGMNKYHSAFDLWQEKLGLVPPFVGNEATLWGKLHEPVVRQQVAERMGLTIRLPSEPIRHPTYTFAACHPDGITDDGILYEGKTARFGDGFGEDGTDEVPETYLVQVQHNMGVCSAIPGARRLERAVLGVLIGGSELRIYNIPANEEMQKLIFEGEARFWNYVLTNTVPPPDTARADAIQVLKRMYPGTDGTSIEANDRLNQVARDLAAHKLIVKNTNELIEQGKAELLAAMGNSTFLQLDDGTKYRRKLITKEPYQVKAQSYIDLRNVK